MENVKDIAQPKPQEAKVLSPIENLVSSIENDIETSKVKGPREAIRDLIKAVENDDVDKITEQKTIDELHDEYINDLKSNSEYSGTIKFEDREYKKISVEENAVKRNEFRQKKEVLIKEWEKENHTEWPRYDKDVYMNDKCIRKVGDRYDAHHIKPLGLNGLNEAYNLTPISAEKHFDKQGVHSPNSPYARLENHLK